MNRWLRSLVFVLAIPALVAAQQPRDLVDQVDRASYHHYMNDVIYAHDGDNRGYGPEHDLTRDAIEAAFTGFGLDTSLQPFSYNGRTYYNVVAVHEGKVQPDVYYIVGSHYDSANTPGADDNGSGTCGILELARIFSQYDFESTLVFITFDREEQGLHGSRAYANAHRQDDIRGMISLDMIAYNMRTNICDIYGRSSSNSVKNALAGAVTRYSNGLRAEVKGPSDNSDHAPFEWAGKPACLLIEDWGNTCYHRQCDSVDTPDYIDYDYAVQMVRSVAGYLAENAGLMGEDTRCDDIRKFKSRCGNRGRLKARVKMRTDAHDGYTLTFGVDHQETFEVTIDGKRAKFSRCCYEGPHTISIDDPADCKDPLEVTCP